MKRYRAIKYIGEWCVYDDLTRKTVRNNESNMKILAVALNISEGQKPSDNSRSDEICEWKRRKSSPQDQYFTTCGKTYIIGDAFRDWKFCHYCGRKLRAMR